MYYKYCIVPQCTYTTVTTPEKVFIYVPRKPEIRKKWLIHMRRNPTDLVNSSSRFICEYHFNMENDVDNYMEYKMGFCSKMYLKKGVVPSKFDCQPDRKGRLLDSDFPRTAYTKRRRAEFLKEIVQQTKAVDTEVPDIEIEENITKTSIERDELEGSEPTPMTSDKATMTDLQFPVQHLPRKVETAEKAVQCTIKVRYRSKSSQANTKMIAVSTSPRKCLTTTSATPPLKMVPFNRKPIKKLVFLEEEQSDSDVFTVEAQSSQHPSAAPYQSEDFEAPTSSNSSDSDSSPEITQTSQQLAKSTIGFIFKKPLHYIGLRRECYFIIRLINEHTNIPIEQILLCLKKIRLNTTFSELEDNFGVSLSYASKLFLKNIPVIASVLRPFIVKIDQNLIKKNTSNFFSA